MSHGIRFDTSPIFKNLSHFHCSECLKSTRFEMEIKYDKSCTLKAHKNIESQSVASKKEEKCNNINNTDESKF